MDKNFKKLQEKLNPLRIKQDEQMSLHTTFKIGGPAQFYVEVEKPEDFVKVVSAARELKINFFIFGGGSNILVSDEGIKGLIIKNNCRNFSVMRMNGRIKNKKIDVDSALLYAESGVIMNQLVRFSIEEGLGGLEYMLGLPGTVGGAIYMNSNFPKTNSFVGDVLQSGRILTEENEVKDVERDYFNFSYDKSTLQKGKDILLSAIFKLYPSDKKILWEKGTGALNYRNNSQPKGASAGCVFKNISISEALNIPTPGRVTSAGYLIDKAGLKGKKEGGVVVSDVHANYILNSGGATAKDVIKLIDIIREEVYKRFGVKLDLEIRKVGF